LGSAFTVASGLYPLKVKKSASSSSGILIAETNEMLKLVFVEGLKEAVKHKHNNPFVLTYYIVRKEEIREFD
jgi:hypothetical protein